MCNKQPPLLEAALRLFYISTMVLKIFGKPQGFSKTPVYVLLEKKVPFEFVEVNRAEGENKTAEYMEKQPFGQMPYLVSLKFIGLSSLYLNSGFINR